VIAYLLAGLPTPRLGVAPEFEPDAFLEQCRGFVSEPRWHDLAAVLGEPVPEETATGPNDSAARAWADLTAQVDEAVGRQRSGRGRREASPPRLRRSKGYRVDVVQAVAKAFEAPHPGVRERALDELRWRLADDVALGDPDGFAALLGRAVQLRLAWRWAGWAEEAGWTALEATLRRIEEAHVHD
jgi:hypothetical protein